MQYAVKDRRQRKIDRTHELVNLWLDCDVPAQFWMRQPIEVPDATALELRSFKLYYFRTCHPVLYHAMWISSFVLLNVVDVFIFTATGSMGIFGTLEIAYLALALLHVCTHGDMMQTIQWFEDGKPMDY